MLSINRPRGFPYFKGFSDPELEKRAAAATEETYDAGLGYRIMKATATPPLPRRPEDK